MQLKNYITKHYKKINPVDVLILIVEGKVHVNNKPMKNPSYNVKDSDLVQFFVSQDAYTPNKEMTINTYGFQNYPQDDKTSSLKKEKLKNIFANESKINKQRKKELTKKRLARIKARKKELKQAKARLAKIDKPISISIDHHAAIEHYQKEIAKKRMQKKKKTRIFSLKRKKNKDSVIHDIKDTGYTGPAIDQLIKTKNKRKNFNNKPIPASRIIYEKNGIIAVNKLQDENVDGNYGRLDKKVALYLENKGQDTTSLKHHNKLDNETKGIVLFTNSKQAEKDLAKVIKERRLVSIYYAICISAPFFNEKKNYDLAIPFIMDSGKKLVQVKEKNKDQLRRIKVDMVGKITIGKVVYPIIRITTRKLREASIRFVLTYYGMTIINEKKMAKSDHSNNLILFHTTIKFSRKIDNSLLKGEVISLNKEEVLKKMKKLLQKTVKSMNND